METPENGKPVSTKKSEREAERKRRRKARRAWRRRRRLALVALLLLSLAVSLLLFAPLPLGKGLREKAGRLVREKTGLGMTIRSAWVDIADGTVELEGVTLKHPRTGASLLRVARVEITGDPKALFGRWGAWPSEVKIEGAPVFPLSWPKEGPRLEGPAQDLAALLGPALQAAAEKKDSPDGAPSRALPRVTLHGGGVALARSEGRIQPFTLLIEEIALAPDPLEPGAFRVTFLTLLETRRSTHLEGAVSFRPSLNLWKFDARIDQLEGETAPGGSGAGVRWRAERPMLRGLAQRRENGAWELSAYGETKRLEVLPSGAGALPPVTTSLRVDTRLALPPDRGALEIQTIQITGPDLNVWAGGEAQLGKPWPFDVKVELNRAPSQIFRLARRELASKGFSYDLPATGSLRINARFQGDLETPRVTEVSGRVFIEELALRHTALAQELKIETLDGRLTREGAKLTIGRWRFGELQGAASADLRGHPLPGQEADVEIQFTTSGSAGELIAPLRRQGLIPLWLDTLDASITGQGEARGKLALGEGRVYLLDPVWQAKLSWNQGRLWLRGFPEAVLSPSGAVEVTPRKIEITRLRALTEGIETRWRAALEGPRFFWAEPAIHLEGEGEARIPEVLRLLRGLGQSPPPVPADLDGSLGFRALWSGSLAAPEQGHWEAALRAQDVEFSTPVDGDTGHVSHLGFEATFTSETARIENLRLFLDDILVEGRADADPRRILANLRIEGPMETVIRLFSNDLSDFRSKGIVPARATAQLIAREPVAEPADLPLALRWAKALGRPGAISFDPAAAFRPKLEAVILPDGAEFYHEEMPIKVTNIRGRLLADETGLTIQQSLSQWGEIQDVKITGRVQLYPLPTRVTFEMESPRLEVETWCSGWGKPEDGIRGQQVYRDPGVQRGEKILAILDGQVKVREVDCFGVQGKDLSGRLYFEAHRVNPNILRLEHLKADTYGGFTSGTMLFTMEHKKPYANCEMVAQMGNVELHGLLSDLLGSPQSVQGKFTGFLKMRTNFVEEDSYSGAGNFFVRDARASGASLFRQISLLLRTSILEETTFQLVQAGVRIEDRRVWLDNLTFDSPGIRLAGDGWVDFHRVMSLLLDISFRSSTLDSIPLLRLAPDPFNLLARQLLRIEVGGRLENPQPRLAPLPTGRDAINRYLLGWF